jgi:hypothetical protein
MDSYLVTNSRQQITNIKKLLKIQKEYFHKS